MPHKMFLVFFLWILRLDTFQMKNPSNATLASMSILKYSKIQNGRQMAENSAKINIIHVKQKAHCSYCPNCLLLVHQTMPVQKRHHELFEKKVKTSQRQDESASIGSHQIAHVGSGMKAHVEPSYHLVFSVCGYRRGFIIMWSYSEISAERSQAFWKRLNLCLCFLRSSHNNKMISKMAAKIMIQRT